jgi:HEAT repeat protein
MPSTTADIRVADFVRGLALAWKNLAAYPSGHPALAGALESVHARLTELRGPAGEVILGIAEDGVVHGDTKIDSLYAQKLAHALHLRGVAVMRFAAETTAHDLEVFLGLVGPLSTRPLSEELTAAGVVNINLEHVDYSSVQMTSDLHEPPAPKPDAPTLWEEILRALLGGRHMSAEAAAKASGLRSVDELTAMIVRTMEGEPERAELDPNATFGVKISARMPDTPDVRSAKLAETIALYVAGTAGTRRKVTIQQLLQLLRALPEALRDAVLRAVTGVLAMDDHSSLRDFAAELPPEDIINALQLLAGTQDISQHAITLLRSLIQAKQKKQPSAVAPDILADLITLFGDEDIDRFNPPDHQALLDQTSIEMPTVTSQLHSIAELGKRVDSVTDDVLNRQLARTLLELLATQGAASDPEPVLERLEDLFRGFLESGAFAEALEVAEGLRVASSELRDSPATRNSPLATSIERSIERLADVETIRSLVERMHEARPEMAAIIQKLMERMGPAASHMLLMALADEDNLGRRRRLFDFAVSLGPAIVPAATRFLADDRWFVVRNVIILLRSVNDRSSLPDIRRMARHPDLRVRMEAIKSLFALDPAGSRELLEEAILAPDPKLAETAIMLAGNYGIKEAVEPLLRMIGGNDIFGARRSLRIRAIKALGELAEPGALPRMERFFRDSWLPWPSKFERRAAYEALASYPADARAPLLEKGLASRDPEIRAICERVTNG